MGKESNSGLDQSRRGYKASNFEKANERRRAMPCCKWGHPFSGENLIIGANGQRRCRTCKNIFNRNRPRRAGIGDGKVSRRNDRCAAHPVALPDNSLARYKGSVNNIDISYADWFKLYGIKPKRG